jgi:hypothetical protein
LSLGSSARKKIFIETGVRLKDAGELTPDTSPHDIDLLRGCGLPPCPTLLHITVILLSSVLRLLTSLLIRIALLQTFVHFMMRCVLWVP